MILTQVPGSDLLLLADDVAGQEPYFREQFNNAGIAPARCRFVSKESHAAHLGKYLCVDLCLDPFPYGGHTTTLDALWMGVPVLSMSGNSAYSRGAASILHRVGLSDLIANSLEDYVTKAVQLAKRPGWLSSLRHGLRERMSQSALCDETGFAAEYEFGLRLAWQRHCRGLPPDDINL